MEQDVFNGIGRLLIFVGFLFILIGGAFLLSCKFPCIGRLPGDINIKKGNFSFHFPIVTCLVISILLSLILAFFNKK